MYMQELSKRVLQGASAPVVLTTEGMVRGIYVEGVHTFRGIPYAKARRFHMAQKADPREGIFEADHFGATPRELTTPFAHDAYRVPHYFYPQDEDCLNLNIWTPGLDGAKRPVMFWIHGGMWSCGHSMEIYSYDGGNLAREKDVVVVGVNHRLNVLGYLDLSAYGEEYLDSGCVGLGDLVAALQWVKENIKAFGGDPDCVTIFGQSGGGSKVISLLQTPAADGLYHRAIMQSGGCGLNQPSVEEKKETDQTYAALLMERLGLSRDTVHEIETLPWHELATAASEAIWLYKKERKGLYRFSPSMGDYFKGHPFAVGFRGETADVPLLVGSCFSEFSNNFDYQPAPGSKNQWSKEQVDALIAEKFGQDGQGVLEAFRASYPMKRDVDLLFLETNTRRGVKKFCSLRAAQQGAASVYSYLFNLEAPFMGGTLPWHNAEEPYVFRNIRYTESQYEPGVSERLEEIVSGAWTAFAAAGNPNHSQMPYWAVVQENQFTTMLFDRECVAALNHDERLLSLHKAPGPGFPHSGFNAAVNGICPRERRE